MERILDRTLEAKAAYSLGTASIAIWSGTQQFQNAMGMVEIRNEAREVGRGQVR